MRLFIESADSGTGVAAEVALVMGRLLGWNRRRRTAETRRYLELVAAEQTTPAGGASAGGASAVGASAVGASAVGASAVGASAVGASAAGAGAAGADAVLAGVAAAG
jgi:hypothetical protein